MSRRLLIIVLAIITISTGILAARGLEYVGALNGALAGDRYGSVVASAGDVNGDGRTDLLVGAPGSYQAKNYPGKVFLFLGGDDPGEPDLVLTGQAAGDRYGIALTGCGDLNDDGYDDFAVAADKNDQGGTDAGKVYIYYGGKGLDPEPDITLTGERANDWFGSSMAAGEDLNGDGIPDIVVGASYAGKNYTGVAYVFLGGSSITRPAVKIEGENSGDSFGEKVAFLGDLDGDQICDFAVSSYYHNSEGNKNAGRVYIFRGGSVISRDPWHTLDGRNPQANFGFDVASAGDFNGDGTPDIAVSAPGDGPEGEGVVYLYMGGPVIRDAAAIFYGDNSKDLYGYSVCAGNVNGDEYSDLLIGSPFADVADYRSGRVEVFYGAKEPDVINDFHVNGNNADSQCGTEVGYVPNFYGRRGGLFLVNSPGPLGNGRKSYLFLYK